MKLTSFFLPGLIVLMTGCNTVTPEKYFDITVLNLNMLTGFADEGMLREIKEPPATMSENNGQPVSLPRQYVIDGKINFANENLKKLKGLRETEDTKEMIQTSIALYEYVIPAYKAEYQQIANLYNQSAPDDKIKEKAKIIRDKYFPRYNELYLKLIVLGKSYAKKHSIEVHWGS